MITTPSSPESRTLHLTVTGLGPVCAFKNRKRIARNRLITDPAIKERLNQIARAFEFQLLSLMRHDIGETLTARQVRSWMQCNWPSDDCWTVIPELMVTAAPGEDGAVIEVMRI